MAYTIIAQGGRLPYGVKFYKCDSVEDLKSLFCTTPGCRAYIGRKVYALNNDLEWTNVTKAIFNPKGSVSTYNDLEKIKDPNVGDVYNVSDTGMNYVYTDDGWDSLGGEVFLSDNYYDKTDIDNITIGINSNISKGDIDTLNAANGYTDAKLENYTTKQYVDNQDSAILTQAQNYTNTSIDNLATVAKTGKFEDLSKIYMVINDYKLNGPGFNLIQNNQQLLQKKPTPVLELPSNSAIKINNIETITSLSYACKFTGPVNNLIDCYLINDNNLYAIKISFQQNTSLSAFNVIIEEGKFIEESSILFPRNFQRIGDNYSSIYTIQTSNRNMYSDNFAVFRIYIDSIDNQIKIYFGTQEFRIINYFPTFATLDSASAVYFGHDSGPKVILKYISYNNSEKFLFTKDNLYESIGENDPILTTDATDTYVNINTPTKLSDLNNDILSTVATSGDYNDLSNKPYIPDKLSDLRNDNNYVQDENYVHTDYNFNQSAYNKLNDDVICTINNQPSYNNNINLLIDDNPIENYTSYVDVNSNGNLSGYEGYSAIAFNEEGNVTTISEPFEVTLSFIYKDKQKEEENTLISFLFGNVRVGFDLSRNILFTAHHPHADGESSIIFNNLSENDIINSIPFELEQNKEYIVQLFFDNQNYLCISELVSKNTLTSYLVPDMLDHSYAIFYPYNVHLKILKYSLKLKNSNVYLIENGLYDTYTNKTDCYTIVNTNNQNFNISLTSPVQTAIADSGIKGIMKLYSRTGNFEDGAISQKTFTEEINKTIQTISINNTTLTKTNQNINITLPTVATTGSYNDLTDKPSLFDGNYNNLTNKPTLFSGDYNDLINKPDFNNMSISGDYNDLVNKPTNLSDFTNDLLYINNIKINQQNLQKDNNNIPHIFLTINDQQLKANYQEQEQGYWNFSSARGYGMAKIRTEDYPLNENDFFINMQIKINKFETESLTALASKDNVLAFKLNNVVMGYNFVSKKMYIAKTVTSDWNGTAFSPVNNKTYLVEKEFPLIFDKIYDIFWQVKNNNLYFYINDTYIKYENYSEINITLDAQTSSSQKIMFYPIGLNCDIYYTCLKASNLFVFQANNKAMENTAYGNNTTPNLLWYTDKNYLAYEAKEDIIYTDNDHFNFSTVRYLNINNKIYEVDNEGIIYFNTPTTISDLTNYKADIKAVIAEENYITLNDINIPTTISDLTNYDTDIKSVIAEVGYLTSVPTANTSTSGIMKLYTSLGTNTDGTITQNVIKTELDKTIQTISINNTTLTKTNQNVNITLPTVATTGSYNDLTDKPTLFSGDYNDLNNKPALFSGNYSDLSNKPSLFSGDYNDLSNKPTIPVVPTNISAFTNDSNYVTQAAIPQSITAFTNYKNDIKSVIAEDGYLLSTLAFPAIIYNNFQTGFCYYNASSSTEDSLLTMNNQTNTWVYNTIINIKFNLMPTNNSIALIGFKVENPKAYIAYGRYNNYYGLMYWDENEVDNNGLPNSPLNTAHFISCPVDTSIHTLTLTASNILSLTLDNNYTITQYVNRSAVTGITALSIQNVSCCITKTEWNYSNGAVTFSHTNDTAVGLQTVGIFANTGFSRSNNFKSYPALVY